MQVKLTDKVIEAAICPPGRRDVLLTDTQQRGLALRVTTAGAKVFLWQGRIGGVVRKERIGPWGEVTLAEARRRAAQLRSATLDKRDPVAERHERQAVAARAVVEAKASAARDAFTVGALIDSWAAGHLAERSASYRARVPREMRAALADWLTVPAERFGRAEAVRILDAVKAGRGPVAANRLHAVCRACWTWITRRGGLGGNPWVDVPRPAREQARERVLTEAELVAVWRSAEGMLHPWNAMVKLLVLTGQRRGEVAGMTWEELDLDAAEWRLPGARTKNGRAHLVPLSSAAVELLRAVPRLQGAALVFENSKGTAPTGFGKVQARLLKATAAATGGADPWVLHDLRRTAATGLQRLGVRLEVTEAVLNHVSGSRAGIVGVYQKHTWRDEARQALEHWAAHVQALADGRGLPAKVAQLDAALRQRAGAAA